MEIPLTVVAPAKATVGRRVIAYLVDFAVSLFFSGAVGVLFGDSKVVAGAMMAAYWLLRDAGGESIGKMVCRLTVVDEQGGPATTRARVMRNSTLAIGPALWMLPGVGIYFAGPVGGLVLLVEIFNLAVNGRRVGDSVAKTDVATAPYLA